MDATLQDLLRLLPGAGLTGALIFFIYGGYKRIWVWGHQLEDCKRQLEECHQKHTEELAAWKDEAKLNGEIAKRYGQLAEMTLTEIKARRQRE